MPRPLSSESLAVAVLAACYNRAAVSEQNLGELYRILAGVEDVKASFFVVDDNSSDDTAARLRRISSDLVVENGTGSLFWTGGMRLAHERARNTSRFDAYLLVNDDVAPFAEGVAAAFDTYRVLNAAHPHIVVGHTVDAHGAVSYTGMRQMPGLAGLPYERVNPQPGKLVDCDGFNGNFVIVPGSVFDQLGGLDGHFVHSFADLDLGLRARALGIRESLVPLPIGLCEQGIPVKRRRVAGSLWVRWVTLLREPDGIRTYVFFVWRHRPKLLWPAYVVQRIINLFRRALALPRMQDSEL